MEDIKLYLAKFGRHDYVEILRDAQSRLTNYAARISDLEACAAKLQRRVNDQQNAVCRAVIVVGAIPAAPKARHYFHRTVKMA